MKRTLLAVEDISKELRKGWGAVLVLSHISVDIYGDDFTIIIGPSGAGKLALLYVLGGMDRVSSRTVIYKGKMISCLRKGQMTKTYSREFGLMFQQTHLVSNLTFFENVTAAGHLGEERKLEETRKQTGALLEQVNVGSAKSRMPAEASGGETQRVAIARAMTNEPGVILADEPTGTLNKRNVGEVPDLLTELNKEDQSILTVTHDLWVAVHGTRLLYPEDGKIPDELSMPVFHLEDERTREAATNDQFTSPQ